jgi:hypothetical protein
MHRGLTRSLLPLAALALSAAVIPVASAATHPPVVIGPNQYFKGIFNGHPPGPAMVFVTCSMGATTGHPVAGQKLWVEQIPTPVGTGPDIGYTGSKGKSVNAAFVPSAATGPAAHFTVYGVKKSIPTTLTLPCSGTGSISFTPAPTSKTARTAKLAVTFGPPPSGSARR